jgi:3-isopropylmalate/(R)-2-methylmalate dehydratase large subunit
MPQTMVEKILARCSGTSDFSVGDILAVDVDLGVVLDMQFYSNVVPWEMPLRISHPERLAVILDHAVPAPSAAEAYGARLAREFVDHFEISRFFDVGRGGICHQVIAEERLGPPGSLLVCSDSHTSAAGAFNAAARGIGGLDMMRVICTGKTWFQVQPSIRLELVGSMPSWASGKDVFLNIAHKFGSAQGMNVEIVGPGVRTMSLNARRTVAIQMVEADADFTIFECDDVLMDYFSAFDTPHDPVGPDANSTYADVWHLDLDDLRRIVAKPGGIVGNTVDVGDLPDEHVDQVFIGSCANGTVDDLRTVADVLEGKLVADGVRLIVTPASQRVFLEASRNGTISTIVAAGGVVTNATCGACFGYHMGVLGPDEVCVTSSTRNFPGRMGDSTARIYLASPAFAANVALTGNLQAATEIVL